MSLVGWADIGQPLVYRELGATELVCKRIAKLSESGFTRLRELLDFKHLIILLIF